MWVQRKVPQIKFLIEKGFDMIGEVRVKTGTPDIIKFTDLVIGGGVIKGNEVRLRIGMDKYLYFPPGNTEVRLLKSFYWPKNLFGQVRTFKLIAEEI